MNEQKKLERAAAKAAAQALTPVPTPAPTPAPTAAPAPAEPSKAQAYAMRVWDGQSVSLGRAERVTRIKAALEGQGLPMDGVKLPGDADDDEWTEQDEQPITYRPQNAA